MQLNHPLELLQVRLSPVVSHHEPHAVDDPALLVGQRDRGPAQVHLFLQPGLSIAKTYWKVVRSRRKMVREFPIATPIQAIFEGLFGNTPLKPGESFSYTFRTAGEYFFNDCAAPMTAGKVVVQQGSVGDFFYVLIEGRCLVTREVPNQKPVHLAELQAGACFGEEALLTDTPRNASVTLLTEGKLTRLAKTDFRQLLNEPLTRRIPFAQAQQEVSQGIAQWLDVRMPSEVAAAPLAGAINIPLFMLRMKLNLLNPQTRYIVVCDSGRRSSVAVFVLRQKGYDVAMLAGGIQQQ
mgnify:CR=1 FL=1